MSTMPMPRSGSSARERANRESLLAERAATECRLGSTNFGSHTCTAVACTCPSGAHRTVCVCLSARSHLFCLCFLASAGSSHVRSAWPIVVPRQRRAELSVHPRMSEPSTCCACFIFACSAGPTDCATQSYTVTGQLRHERLDCKTLCWVLPCRQQSVHSRFKRLRSCNPREYSPRRCAALLCTPLRMICNPVFCHAQPTFRELAKCLMRA